VHDNPLYNAQRQGAIDRLDVTALRPQEMAETVALPAVGISVDFLDTNGWFRVRGPDAGVAFAKNVDPARRHTAGVVVGAVFPPRTDFSTLDDFFRYSKADLETTRDKANDLEFVVEPSTVVAPFCVALHRRTKASAASIGMAWRTLTTETHEYLCRHPYRARQFVKLHYSERFFTSDNIPGVRARADDMFKRIAFLE